MVVEKDVAFVVAVVMLVADMKEAWILLTLLIYLHLQIAIIKSNISNNLKNIKAIVSTTEISSSADENSGKMNK